ncbi:MAG: nucleotidyltransferase family protein [bacterium]|nr:nucleotidyltransferase family protein [bacterium]
MTPTESLRQLVRAWAGVVPVPTAPPSDPGGLWRLLWDHHVEAALGPLLPAAARNEHTDAAVAQARARTTQLLLELERLAPALEAAACRPVVLKGAALALSHYRDPAERWFVDLDVLVAPDKVDRACAALGELGYRTLETHVPVKLYDEFHLHRILEGPGNTVVEIHWALTLPGSVYAYDTDGVRERACEAALGGTTCRVAAPEDQVLHAVYQHVADGYADLRRVLDLELLSRSMDETAWRRVADLAEAGRMSRPLALWLDVAASILGRPVKDDLWIHSPLWPRARRAVANLNVADGCLSRRATTTPGYVEFLHLLLVPGRSRWRELWRALVPDDERVVGAGHVPGPLGGWPGRIRAGLHNGRDLVRVAWVACRG